MNQRLVTVFPYPDGVVKFKFFLITLLALLGLYAVIYPFMVESMATSEDSIYVSIPFFMTYGILSALFVFRSGIPSHAFGLRLTGSGPIVKSLKWSLLFILALTIIKWVLTIAPTKWMGRPVIELTFFEQFGGLKTLSFIVLYLLFVPVQEFIVRSALMGSILYYLKGPIVPVLSVLVSAILYSLAHLYMGWFVSLAVLLPGLFWAILFYKTKSLAAVSISHAIIGLYTLFFLNLI
ncbi:MAG: CPBP family intramembrane glutamic endopeptidase [Bacteroidota bacterium]